ncbi:MAG: hypothetical protein KF865_12515 [Bdellovibrionaceae bacterium]|nr:hypothetical protein [Pseudobdellovibrionaceae bacterium]
MRLLFGFPQDPSLGNGHFALKICDQEEAVVSAPEAIRVIVESHLARSLHSGVSGTSERRWVS